MQMDGLSLLDEQKWGKWLMAFEHDHLEVVGFNPEVNPRHIAALMIDNLRVHDQRLYKSIIKKSMTIE